MRVEFRSGMHTKDMMCLGLEFVYRKHPYFSDDNGTQWFGSSPIGQREWMVSVRFANMWAHLTLFGAALSQRSV